MEICGNQNRANFSLRMFQLEGRVVVDSESSNLFVAYCHSVTSLNITLVQFSANRERLRSFSFFGFVQLFSRIFLPQKVPFYFFRHCETVFFKKFFGCSRLHFEVLLLFFNLRYGADLGRSRFVSFKVN